MSPKQSQSLRSLLSPKWPIVALTLVALVVFGRVLPYEATLDSGAFLQGDARITEFEVGEILTTDYWNRGSNDLSQNERPGLYRPLTLLWMSFFAQAASDEDHAKGEFRMLNAANLLLHVLGVLLRYCLLLLLFSSFQHAAKWAFLAALICAVHPVATEAVATQVGAAEGLSVVFSTASLIAFVMGLRSGRKLPWVVACLTLLLALLSKESAAAFPGVAFLIAWVIDGRGVAKSFAAALPYLAVFAAWLGIRFLVLGQAAGVNDPTLGLFPAIPRLATALATLGSYDLQALLLPFWLHPNPSLQDMPPADSLADPRALVGIVVLLLILGGFLWARPRAPKVAFGLAFLGGTFLPVSNLLVPIGALTATRFLYLPIFGYAVAVVAMARVLLNRDRPPLRILAFALLGFATVVPLIASMMGTSMWANNRALWEQTSKTWPSSGQAWYNLGNLQRLSGEDPKTVLESYDHARNSLLPVVPNTDGLVQEDALDLTFQASINAGAIILQGIANPLLRKGPGFIGQAEDWIRKALVRFEGAQKIAEQGLALEARGTRNTTDWDALSIDAQLARVQALSMRVNILPTDRRATAMVRINQLLDEAQARYPDSLKITVAKLRLNPTKFNAEIHSLYERAMKAQKKGELQAVTQAYVQAFIQRDPERAARAMLRAIVDGPLDAAPDEMIIAAERCMNSRSAPTRALGKRSLEYLLDQERGVSATQRARCQQLLDAKR